MTVRLCFYRRFFFASTKQHLGFDLLLLAVDGHQDKQASKIELLEQRRQSHILASLLLADEQTWCKSDTADTIAHGWQVNFDCSLVCLILLHLLLVDPSVSLHLVTTCNNCFIRWVMILSCHGN